MPWLARDASATEPPATPDAPASVTLLMALPDDALLAGELELIQAHFAGLIDQVFAPEVDSEPHHGDDTPWP